MLLKKIQHSGSILAKGMTAHPSTFPPLPLQPAAPRTRLSQLKEGDTETGKGELFPCPVPPPSDVIWGPSKPGREDARESLPRSSPNPGPLWGSACPPGNTCLIWKSGLRREGSEERHGSPEGTQRAGDGGDHVAQAKAGLVQRRVGMLSGAGARNP